MKKSLILASAFVVLASLVALSASDVAPGFAREAIRPTANPLICKRPATPANQIDIDRCHGNWSPIDNTNNWKYEARTGNDRFVRKSGNSGDRACSKCPNGGSIKQDAHGIEDWCVKLVAAVPAATATPSCPSGFTWDGSICFRPGIPAHNEGVDRCHGNWSPIDNTNNWKYEARTGNDRFVRKSGNSGDRACSKCPNGGNISQDFQGLQDWCVNFVPAVTPATAIPSCPPGFTLALQ